MLILKNHLKVHKSIFYLSNSTKQIKYVCLIFQKIRHIRMGQARQHFTATRLPLAQLSAMHPPLPSTRTAAVVILSMCKPRTEFRPLNLGRISSTRRRLSICTRRLDLQLSPDHPESCLKLSLVSSELSHLV